MTADTASGDRSATGAVRAEVDPDAGVVRAVLAGDRDAFEEVVVRYQAKVFATARRYARRESEVEDIVQEVFLKAFRKLSSFRGDAPFEHWLMRMAVRTCYDFLRKHQRNREFALSSLSDTEELWLERIAVDPGGDDDDAEAARTLVAKLLESLAPASRMVVTLLDIEGRSVREISELTGWSVSLVKVRAFRARREMRKRLKALDAGRYV